MLCQFLWTAMRGHGAVAKFQGWEQGLRSSASMIFLLVRRMFWEQTRRVFEDVAKHLKSLYKPTCTKLHQKARHHMSQPQPLSPKWLTRWIHLFEWETILLWSADTCQLPCLPSTDPPRTSPNYHSKYIQVFLDFCCSKLFYARVCSFSKK